MIGQWNEARYPGFDDSRWESISPGWSWDRSQGERWFRREIVIPEEISGVNLGGSTIEIRLVYLAGVELFIDGEFVDGAGYWFDGRFPISKKAVPGERHIVALRSPQAEVWGHFNFAEWYIDRIEDILLDISLVDARTRLICDLADLGRLDPQNPGVQAARRGLQLDLLDPIDLTKLHGLLAEHDSRIIPAATGLSNLTSFLVGHAHIDMNWLWDYDDTVDTSRRTFRSVDGLMNEFPDLIFSQSQAAVYRMMEEQKPEIFERIRKRVGEGRWDVTASTWVEGDLNMACGESLVRQTTMALNYVEEKFGVTPRVAWCPDTFGHPWTYPQILSKCGIDYYYAHRCNRGEAEHLFWWESPDGSRILVFNEGVTYNNRITPELTRSFPKMLRNFDVPCHLVVFGVGDHGGGPTREDLRNALRMNREKEFPRFRHAAAHEFFESIKDSGRIPVVRDELNFVFEGCYTTHADIKRMNRRGEAMLYETEVLASLARICGNEYPYGDLETAWHNVLFNQFHDLLDGSAIKIAYEHSNKLFEQTTDICRRISVEAERALLKPMAHESCSIGVVVLNVLGWKRTDLVKVKMPKGIGDQVAVLDKASGKRVPSQVQDEEVLFEATVPAVGFKEYKITSDGPIDVNDNDLDAPRATPASGRGQPHILENRFFRLGIDPETGTITSLMDKRLNQELVSPVEAFNVFQMCYEKPHGMSAWRIGPISRTENLLGGAITNITQNGRIQAAVRIEREFGKSSLKQDIVIHREIPRIDFVTEIDWHEVGGPSVDSPMLKVSLPLAYSSAICVREIPFGHIESPTDGREIPSQTFLELPGDGYGVALLNDCKYGHDVRGNTIHLTLLRAAYDPDPLPDVGHHKIIYSLFPHHGDWRSSEVWKRGHEINMPLSPIVGRAEGPRRSMLSVNADGVDLAAFKGADDGKGFIVRLVEMNGRSVEVNLKIGWSATKITKCNLREDPTGTPIKISKGTAKLELHPYEIGTWRLE